MPQYAPVIDLSTLDGSDGFRLFGSVNGGLVGYSVSSAGGGADKLTGGAGADRLTGKTSLSLDVDGDGKADMVVLIDGDHHDFTGFTL